MNKLFLLPLLLLAVGIFFVRMGASATSWTAQRESLTQAVWLLAENFERESLLTQEQQAAKQRLAAREKVAEELLAGRIGLLEAAAHFRELNRLLPQGGRHVLQFLSGATEDERACRQVIRWIGYSGMLPSEPNSSPVSLRLEAELEERLKRDGTIHLPAVTPMVP